LIITAPYLAASGLCLLSAYMYNSYRTNQVPSVILFLISVHVHLTHLVPIVQEPLRGGALLSPIHPTSFAYPAFAIMPGPGARRQKPKSKKPVQPPFVSLTDNPISTFATDINHEEGWQIVVDMLCKHLQLPGTLRTRLSSIG